MAESQIYSEFGSEVVWIKNEVRIHSLTLQSDFDPYVSYYLNDRLKILSSGPPAIARAAGFLPYGVFWLASAFQLHKQPSIRELTLGLVYEIISITLIDD